EAAELLDRAGDDGGSVLVRGTAAHPSSAFAPPPQTGARRLLDLVRGPSDALALAAPLLRDTWLVHDLRPLPEDFRGVAVTRGGRVWFGAWRELRQVPAGGADLVLARRNERRALV